MKLEFNKVTQEGEWMSKREQKKEKRKARERIPKMRLWQHHPRERFCRVSFSLGICFYCLLFVLILFLDFQSPFNKTKLIEKCSWKFWSKKTSRMHFRKFRCVCEDVRMRQNVRRLKRRESSGNFTILNIVCDRLLRSFMLVTPTCRRTDQHNNEWSDHYIITCYKSKQRYKFLLSPFCNSVKIWPGVVTISSLASTNTPFSWTQSVERYLSVTSKIKRFKRSQTIESEENKSGPNLRALSSYHLIRSEDLWYIRCKFPNKKLSIKILDLESELIKKEKW